MKNILLLVSFILLFYFSGCSSPSNGQDNTTSIPAATSTQPPPTSTILPTYTNTPLPTITLTPTPLPNIGSVSYTGYWLKISKEFDPNGFQKMSLMYQDGFNLVEIAWFCVRASDNNTPDGFYFVAVDRPTTYPTAHGGYATTFFSHNLAIKLANRSWYLHAAPWNESEAFGCPTNNTGGCVNMRTDDFKIIVEGGEYKNPITGETSQVPDISVGTPVIIVPSKTTCDYIGNCFDYFECKSGLDCFKRYTCQLCVLNAESKWEAILAQAPNLAVFQNNP